MALNLENYAQTVWAPEMPITADRMNNLDTGVFVNREALKSLDAAIDILQTDMSYRPTTTQVTNLVEQGSIQGAWARTAIVEAMHGDEYASLDSRLGEIDDLIQRIREALGQGVSDEDERFDRYTGENPVYNNIQELQRNIQTAWIEINNARVDGVHHITRDSLYDQFTAIWRDVTDIWSEITTIEDSAGKDPQGEAYTLATRIHQLQLIYDEILATHREDVENDQLVLRFLDNESEISKHATAIGELSDNKINYSDIINDFLHTDTNKPLSAARGKELRDIIGGTYDALNTVTGAINTAQNTAEANAEAYTNSLLGEGFSTTDTVAAAINALESTDNATDERLSAIEDEIAAAHRDLGTDEETEEIIADSLNKRFTDSEQLIAALRAEINAAHDSAALDDTTYESLDERLEAIETYALAIRSDVISIASELAMIDEDTQAIKDTNTKIDDLERDIRSFAAELAMGRDENGALVEANTRIDALEDEIDAAHRTSDDTLDARFDDLEAAISHVADSEDPEDKGGLTERMAAVETLASSANATANAAATQASFDVLAGRVQTLEDQPKSATIVIDDVYFDENGVPQISNPTTDADYLLKNGDKYYYWKYIQTSTSPALYEWALISGGSGSGNSSGYDLAAADYDTLASHDENTDYYVAREDGIHHYRYVYDAATDALREVEIGQFVDLNKIKRYNIDTETGELEGEEVTYLNLYQYDYDELSNDLDSEKEPLTRIILPKGGGSAVSANINKLTRIGDQSIQRITGSQILLRVFYSSWDSDGAESSAGEYTLRAGNTVIASGIMASGAQNVDLSAGWQEGVTGFYEFDVSNYCNIGNTTFNLSVAVNGTTLGKSWTVNIVDLHLESTVPDVLLISAAEDYSFPYTPFGALSKVLHIIIDDDLDNETTTALSAVTSGRVAYATIPAQSHGTHKIEMYLTATVGGVPQTTPSIVREYIWYDDSVGTTLLASPYNAQTVTTQQYSTVEIPYQVYKKDATSIQVEYYVDGASTPFDTVTLEDVNSGVLSYLATEQGTHTITIKVDNISIDIALEITELEINVAPVAGAIIDFDPTTLTNSSANRLPSWTVGSNTYKLTASDNFNWSEDTSGGGYKTDEDGKAFVIKAGSYVDLDYPMFAGNSSNNVLSTNRGAEMKIIFKTEAVRDINAVWFTNTGTLTGKTVGIQLGAHSGWLKTDKATDSSTSAADSEYPTWESGKTYNVDDIVLYKDTIYKCIASVNSANSETDPKTLSASWLSMGKIDTEVLATNSYLYFPYSEEDKIELDININSYDPTGATNFIMSYEDGVPSKAYAYEYGNAGDGLYHNNTIRIGSPDCDVYIYRMRIYNQSLDTDDILQNFIADGRDINEKVKRYDRNCIYWDESQGKYFTSPSATAVLDPIKLAEVMPDVKVLMLDTPVFTTGKKNFVQGSSLRCIHAEGGNVYKSRGDADNWLFTNGFHSGQGTTSDNYGQSARNVDFLFEVDGVHYPTKKKNMGGYTPSEDYVSSVYVGADASTWNGTTWEPAREPKDIEVCKDWKGDECKVALTETSVPNNYFNLKVNVASSENVNNALFQKRYNDFLVYNAPAQTAQIRKHRAMYAALGVNPNNVKVKNSMEFVPAVLFVRENDPDIGKHTEFQDTHYHFYALGNIGDSKKTDYTRAYDPDDMNEFTCEDSDNNTNNGQFQSGVFMYQGIRAIETPYAAYDASKTYAAGDIVVNNGTIQVYNGSAWSNATLTGWTDAATPYFAPYTAPNTMQYLFPITSSEWNVQVNGGYVNYKRYTLETEEFDGDHSFEFRYACRGDYRDGDLINESEGQDDDAQFALNHGVMLAFYEWLITATEEQYVAEASEWMVKSAMEFFYAYTHYYTMMDNRAKNTFWHFAKTGTHLKVSRPVAALLHVYDELVDGEYVRTEDTAIDPAKTYYTEYAFDLFVYDTDTAAGIDNNGALVFPYGKEDDDYRTEGDPSSGYAFNGAGSIFWRRLKTSFAAEIRDVMSSTNPNCFNSEDLIREFDTFQECFPEEIWRLDIERKYIRTFTGASIDNSVTTGKQNPRFLKSMMQGRKKYQRRQWVRDQGVYFNSKYRLSDITDNGNTIEFNCTTPADIENIAVAPSYYLQLTPYQDMYLNVQVGNGNYKDSYITADGSKSLRAKAGQTYTFDLSGNYQETRIYINGANHLSAIGNLAPMYPYEFDLRALAHIKTLDIGTDVAGYTNTKFTTLTLPTFMPLLESLNIKNCHSIASTINLKTANNIRAVEAMGTTITGISLPDYTNIETLHIPYTVASLDLHGARKLTDFKVYNAAGVNDYSTLYKLHVYDSDYSTEVNWINIASSILTNKRPETEISLLRLSTASIGNIQDLEPFRTFKEELDSYGTGFIRLGGEVNVTGDWSEIEKTTYENTWREDALELKVIDDAEHKKTKHLLTYHYEEDGVEKTYSIYVNDQATIEDIYYNGVLAAMPSRNPTAQYTYTFGERYASGEYVELSGWMIGGDSETLAAKEARLGYPSRVTANTQVYAVFNTTARRYPVRWYLESTDSTPIKTSTGVAYGGGTNLEAPTVKDIQDAGRNTYSITFNNNANPIEVTYKIFNGWEKLPININPSAEDSAYNIYATWLQGNNVPLTTIFADTSTISPVQLLVFANMTESLRANYLTVGQQFTLETGYTGLDRDGIAGELLIGAGATHQMTNARGNSAAYSIARFDSTGGTSPFASTIQPLKAGNDEFTLAIDYSFDQSAIEAQVANEAVLVSCYEKTSTNTAGFRLYYRRNEGVKVSFGDTTIDNGNTTQAKLISSATAASYRNTIVLRHPKDSTVLYIYSGINGDGALAATDDSAFIQTIEWNNPNTDAYLVFGNLALQNDSSTMVAGKGIIYWAKYWNVDLGVGECRQLANWNHQTMTYAVEEYAGQNSALGRTVFPDSVGAPPSLVITSLTTPTYGHTYLSNSRTAGDAIQWPGSTLQSIANNRIFLSLPVAMQSVLAKSPVRSRTSRYSSTGFSSSYMIGESDVLRSEDYVFFPSSVEYGNDDSNYRGHEAASAMNWHNTGKVMVYTFNSGTSGWNSGVSNADYMNLRFPGVAIKTGAQVNRVFTGYAGNSPVYDLIDDIARGDIVIYNEQDAYIYVTNTDVLNGAKIVVATATSNPFFYCSGGGGWVKAEPYWTRSPYDQNGTRGTFMYVTTRGMLISNAEAPATDGYAYNYSFSI